jgi:putative membrane protein
MSSDRARRSEEKFLMKAHASGMREIQLSQLAASRATDPRVRSYAQQLVSEHQEMAQDLKPLVSSAGLDMKMMDSSSSSMNSGMDASHGSSPGASTANRSATSSTDSTRGSNLATAGSSDTNLAGNTDGSRAPGYASNTGTDRMDDSGKGVRDRWSRMLNDRKQRKLMEKSGADFDKAYINLMVDEHESAVDLFQDGADDGNPQVQAFAAKYLPKLRQHLEQAEQLDKSLK